MKVLALDFSSSQRTVAVVGPAGSGEAALQSEVIEAGGRSTMAFDMVERALADVRLEREAVECIAVGLGPGSYTGIRAAIALAQGWQLARDLRLLGVGTVEVLAAQAQADGIRGPVHLVIDAQRGEFYWSAWDLSDGGCTEAGPLRIVPREEVEARLATGAVVLGPDLKRVFPQIHELFPSARVLGRLSLDRTDFVRGENLKPIYLRKTSFVKAPRPRVIS